MSFIEGTERGQVSLLPPCLDDYVAPDALVRMVDAFVASLDLAELGFGRTVAASTGRPGYRPGDMLRLYIWGYLNQLRSSRHLERACTRDLEALWLLRRLAPDYRTIADFRHDNPEAIIAASAAFIQFCKEAGPISGRLVELDGTKMRAVASSKNIAGEDRLARDLAHTESRAALCCCRWRFVPPSFGAAWGFSPQKGVCRRPWRRPGGRFPLNGLSDRSHPMTPNWRGSDSQSAGNLGIRIRISAGAA